MTGYKNLKETLLMKIAGQEPFFVEQQKALLNDAEKIILTQEPNAEDISAAAYAKCINDLIYKAGFPEYYGGISTLIMSYVENSTVPLLQSRARSK